MTTCKSCGAEIIYIKMAKSGKMMPCDAQAISCQERIKDSVKKGESLVLVQADGTGRIAKVLTDVTGGADPDGPWEFGHLPHFTNCAFASKYRKGKDNE
jgi:hypothetical protein